MPNMQMKKALWEGGKERAIMELSEAESQEIAEYVQNMHREQQK